MKITKCSHGDCGMDFKIDNQDICCFFCEFRKRCRLVCTKIDDDTSKDDIMTCEDFIRD